MGTHAEREDERFAHLADSVPRRLQSMKNAIISLEAGDPARIRLESELHDLAQEMQVLLRESLLESHRYKRWLRSGRKWYSVYDRYYLYEDSIPFALRSLDLPSSRTSLVRSALGSIAFALGVCTILAFLAVMLFRGQFFADQLAALLKSPTAAFALASLFGGVLLSEPALFAVCGAVASAGIFWLVSAALRLPAERAIEKVCLLTVVVILGYEFSLIL